MARIFNDSDIVVLNAGGKLFSTRVQTLRPSAYFRSMFGLMGTRPSEPQPDGTYFVDCNPDLFEFMLQCLQSGGIAPTPCKFLKEYMQEMFIKFDIPLKPTPKKDFKSLQTELTALCNRRIEETDFTKEESIELTIYFTKNFEWKTYKHTIEELSGRDIQVALNYSTWTSYLSPIFEEQALLSHFFRNVSVKPDHPSFPHLQGGPLKTIERRKSCVQLTIGRIKNSSVRRRTNVTRTNISRFEKAVLKAQGQLERSSDEDFEDDE